MDKIYLDHAASTPLSNATKNYIVELLDQFYNPSSLYQDAVNVKKILVKSRQVVANFINANQEDVFFTCSGSASNALAICGFLRKNNSYIVYSPIAHKSILKCIDASRNTSYQLDVDNKGFVDVDGLKMFLECLDSKVFVVLDYANSEIGTIQDIRKIINIVHEYNGIVMLDCTGSIPTVPLNVKDIDVDIACFSGHKLNSLKGCGVLYKKSDISLEPIVYGTQEQGLFGGTENIISIASLSKAIEQHNYSSISSKSRDFVYDYIVHNIEDTYLIGADLGQKRLSNNLYMCFKGVEGGLLTTIMDINGIQIGTGSACNNYINTPSVTLEAIGVEKIDQNSCIRLSFSGSETKEELEYICETLKKCVEQLRCF